MSTLRPDLTMSTLQSRFNFALQSSNPFSYAHSEDVTDRLLADSPQNYEDFAANEESESVGGIHDMWEQVDERYLKPIFGGYPREKSNQPGKITRKASLVNRSDRSTSMGSNDSSPRVSLAEISRSHDASSA